MERVSPPAVQSLECQVWRVGDERALAGVRAAPDEAAIGIAFDSRAYVVVMGTPLDVEDLARGFAISERIARPDEIERVSVSATPDGLMADVRLAPAAGRALGLARRRAQESRSSCGLCGIERLSDAVRTMPRLAVTLRLSREAVQRALAEL
ncbi:MAG: formate dehydrogenase accessory sulfurtransferase FdhD, partial [Caulobacteraceae bacterium]|nr:formate dehydrogenase accessory sulfurtransferase FdhD [Caulobacteraceae bacterium]